MLKIAGKNDSIEYSGTCIFHNQTLYIHFLPLGTEVERVQVIGQIWELLPGILGAMACWGFAA